MGQSRVTTTSLLDGLRLKEANAWDRFVRIYGPIVAVWLRRHHLKTHDVDDITQEVFAAAATGLPRYEHQSRKNGSLRAWLYGITRHKLYDWCAARRNRIEAAGGDSVLLLGQLPMPESEDAAGTVDESRMQLAARALALLKTDFAEHTWQAFWRTVIAGEPTNEVADDLQMAAKAVRQARYRVLRHLRMELGEDLPGDAD